MIEPELGICQWFHYEDEAGLERAAELLGDLGVRHVRTGISWADYHRPNGAAWAGKVLHTLRSFEILLSVWHTPPSLSEGGTCASPPKRLGDFADFIDEIITVLGDFFQYLEVWNEPNNRYKWDFEGYDPAWRKFGEMAGTAAYWAKARGVSTVLGGMIPVDHHWLNLMKKHGAFQYMDKIGIHCFPGMWWPDAPNWDWQRDWKGWAEKLGYIRPYCEGKPVWVTETGFATWDLNRACESGFDAQVRALEAAAKAPAERVYWYSLCDLDLARPAIEGFHVDENEYHLGLVRHDGAKKEAYYRMKELQRERLMRSDRFVQNA